MLDPQVLFGAASEEEKEERFDKTIADLLLAEYGVPKKVARSLYSRMGPEYTTPAVANLLQLPCQVHAGLVFKFNFEELFSRKSSHKKLVENYRRFDDGSGSYHVVMRSYGLGKLVLSEMAEVPGEDTPVLRLGASMGEAVYLHHFKRFFPRLYPEGGLGDT